MLRNCVCFMHVSICLFKLKCNWVIFININTIRRRLKDLKWRSTVLNWYLLYQESPFESPCYGKFIVQLSVWKFTWICLKYLLDYWYIDTLITWISVKAVTALVKVMNWNRFYILLIFLYVTSIRILLKFSLYTYKM